MKIKKSIKADINKMLGKRNLFVDFLNCYKNMRDFQGNEKLS